MLRKSLSLSHYYLHLDQDLLERKMNFVHSLIILLLGVVGLCHSFSFEEDIILSASQVKALGELKQRVLPLLPQDWMKEDIYISKWLRAGGYDVSKGEELLRKHLEWRKSTNFDNLPADYFDDFKIDYPYDLKGVDREGRPVLLWYTGEWDIRAAAVAGKLEKLIVYSSKMCTDAWLKVREFQKEGKNVTRFGIVADLGNVNLAQHINPATMPFYIEATLNFNKNFPSMTDYILGINTPAIFELAINVAKPLLDEETQKTLIFYGSNKSIWQKVLDSKIDRSQLPKQFGGHLVRDDSS